MVDEKKETPIGAKPIAVKRHSLYSMATIWWTCLRATKSETICSPQLPAFEAGLQGTIPTGSDTSDLILVACNDAYFESYARALVNSAASVGQCLAIHIHLLEPSQKTIEEAQLLQNRHSTIHLTFTVDRCEAANNLRFRNVYYTAARFLLVPSLLQRGVNRVLVIDVDTIMKNSPWPILDRIAEPHDGAFIFRRRQWKPWKKILASAVYYRSSERSLTMASRIANSILTALELSPRYHIDQIIPHYLFRIGGHGLRSMFLNMPHDIMSYRYETSAAFWTTKGPEKRSSQFTQAKAQFET